MDVETLSPQQLNAIKGQLEEEVEKLTTSFAQLRHARTKYLASRSALEDLEAREVLVPLTGSVYVPGRIIDADKVMVEIGTGYFVEKNKEAGKEFCERKMKMLRENMEKVSAYINQRRRTLDLVIQTLQKKVKEQQDKATAS